METLHSGGEGVEFAVLVAVQSEHGPVTAMSWSLRVAAAASVTLLIAIDTSFGRRDPVASCRARVEAARRHGYAALRERHLADYQPRYRRVELDLGTGPAADEPTDELLARVKAGAADASLTPLFFHYARYLLLSCSREDSPLPANLQGIWNDDRACRMGWTCDFHLDVNTQMNYWPAEVCNLAECHEPLFRLGGVAARSGPAHRYAHLRLSRPAHGCARPPLRARIERAAARLAPLRVGRHGQLQEWHRDYAEPEPDHRPSVT